MNKLDWYFKQIVTAAEMDEVFDWVEEADHALVQELMCNTFSSPDPTYGGIVLGGAVAEQAVPDLTVAVTGLSAWGKLGERIRVSELTTNVDCSLDEYGTPTEVTVPGESRILSIFARRKIELQDPATDGNGLLVYTKKVETAEFFVRAGVSAVSPVAVPLISDALLLADITLLEGQTSIQNADISVARREDFLRLTGGALTLTSGSARGSLNQMFDWIDALWSGGQPFSFSKTWWGSVAVGVAGGTPPTTVAEAFNALVEDLASSTAGCGAQLIGSPESEDIDFYRFSDIRTLPYTNGTITGESGAQVVVIYHPVDTDNCTWLLCRHVDGTPYFMPGSREKVKNGETYFDPPDAYLMTGSSAEDALLGDSVQDALLELFKSVTKASRWDGTTSFMPVREFVTGGSTKLFGGTNVHSLAGGGGEQGGPLYQLRMGSTPISPFEPVWPLGWRNYVDVPDINNICDLARGWSWLWDAHCVYAIGDELKVSLVTFKPGVSGPLVANTANMTDTAGDLLSDTVPWATPHAIASNGDTIFVLVADAPAPSPNYIHSTLYAYDARTFNIGSPTYTNLICKWSMDLGASDSALNLWKTYSRLVASDEYVFALLGGEDTQSGGTGKPLRRLDVADGGNMISGLGNGTAAGTAAYPSGGLAFSREQTPGDTYLFYTAYTPSGPGPAEIIPSGYDLATHASLTRKDIVSSFPVKDIVVVGQLVVVPNPRKPVPSSVCTLQVWDILKDEFNVSILDLPHCSQDYVGHALAFDGTRMFCRYADENHLATGENHIVAPVHPAELIRDTEGHNPSWRPRYAISFPESTDLPYDTEPGDRTGRIVAWGPGIWYVITECQSSLLYFLPIAGL